MKKMRKQEPIFSILEEMALDISAVKPVEQNTPQRAEESHLFEKKTGTTTEETSIPVSVATEPATAVNPDFAFVYISPGSFLMGSPEYEPGRNKDETQHQVTLTEGFYIQVTPVTQRQWVSVMGFNPSTFADRGDDCPVEGITWIQCQEFIRKLNSAGEYSYRLPTEAEWEYACRAGSLGPFANGELLEPLCALDPNLDCMGWYCGNSGRTVHPVAQKAPNAWGIFDMHGNLCEWCQDWYGDYPSSDQFDPSGAPFGPGRVVRGGSWFSSAKNCRSACRFHWPPNSRSDFIGFRLVRS